MALGVLFVAPQVLMFEASLGRWSAHGGVVHEWSAANYIRAAEPLYLEILGRSVGLALATTAVCLALGYPMAYWLARRVPRRFRSALLVLVILPFWTSFLVRMYAWMFILRNEGVLNSALSAASTTANQCTNGYLLYRFYVDADSSGTFNANRSAC